MHEVISDSHQLATLLGYWRLIAITQILSPRPAHELWALSEANDERSRGRIHRRERRDEVGRPCEYEDYSQCAGR